MKKNIKIKKNIHLLVDFPFESEKFQKCYCYRSSLPPNFFQIDIVNISILKIIEVHKEGSIMS